MRLYHKSHISDTMGIDAVHMYFEDSLYNGGKAIKIIFERDQSSKVRQRNLVCKNYFILFLKKTYITLIVM